MPSTYSSNLRLELIGAGEQAGTWGTTTNTNLGTLIEQAISGVASVSMTDANYTLTTANGATDEARNMVLSITSSVPLTATRNVTCPAVRKLYVVYNGTSGGQSIVLTTGTAPTVVIPNGATVLVFCNGTSLQSALTHAPAGLTTTALAVAGSNIATQPTFRNRVINGDFLVWQRGTSQTASGYGSDDRWANANNGSTKTHSLQFFTLGQTAVPGEPAAFSRTVVSSVAGASNFVVKHHRMEGVRTFAGQTITISFWAKADASRSIAIDFAQNFGTGGSPSAAVVAIGAQQFNLTTAWQYFTATISVPSISGKTIGTGNNDFFELTIWFDAGSSYNARTVSLGQQSGTFDIARVQVEAGPVATPFEYRPFGLEVALCQRYYQTATFYILYGAYTPGAYGQTQITFPTYMRATPTVALSVGFSANTSSPTVADKNDQAMIIRTTATTTTPAAEVSGVYTADSEL